MDDTKRPRGRPIEFDWRLGAAIAVLGSYAGSLRALEDWLRWPARSTLRRWRKVDPAFDVLLRAAFFEHEGRELEEAARARGDLKAAGRIREGGHVNRRTILWVLRAVGEGREADSIRAYLTAGKSQKDIG
jgi:hypothetical protein